MNRTTTAFLFIMLCALLGITSPAAFASHESHDHGSGATRSESEPREWTAGEVRKVDRAGSAITLRHDEVKNLSMAAMTMSWKVKDAQLLDGLKPGDKVRFTAEKVAGEYTVMSLERSQ
jgi:Cu/Ag efflux protein CusF